MGKVRIIPCLLLKDKGLVKTIKFKDPKYVGDPINAVKIFNTKEVHELIFLDITATNEKKKPPLDYIQKISDECFMPLTVGGGIKSIEDIRELINAGAEKVALNSYAVENSSFITDAAKIFGSQAVLVSIDAKKKKDGSYEVFTHSGKKATGKDPVTLARQFEECGAGEILINSMDQDGTSEGYDINLIRSVADAVRIPIIACGGAGNLSHLRQAVDEGHASAVAAGSMFVFHGKKRAVLINFPTKSEIELLFGGKK